MGLQGVRHESHEGDYQSIEGSWSYGHHTISVSYRGLDDREEIYYYSIALDRRRDWLSMPVFFSGEFRGQRSLAGYSPRGRKESDKTERLTLSLFS